MPAPIDKLQSSFVFSQSSLQDYVDCQRRFQLRYIQQRAWPAVEAEPAMDNEHFMQRGLQFHQMAHQYWLGVPKEKIAGQVKGDKILSRWWKNFAGSKGFEERNFQNQKPFPEISLSAPIGDFRIMAKYDLLVIQPEGKAIIFDWKTSRKRPKREWLIHRLQSRVYPYLLVQAGAQLNEGEPFKPEQIEMIYWYTDFPDQLARIPYSPKQFDEDQAYLARLISEIQSMGEGEAPLTEDERRCRFCVYRSLCNRGVEAGPLEEAEGDWEAEGGFELELGFEHIAEIEY